MQQGLRNLTTKGMSIQTAGRALTTYDEHLRMSDIMKYN